MGRRTLIAAGLAAGALAGLAAEPSCSSESDVIIPRPDAGPACGSNYGPACAAGFACVNSICENGVITIGQPSSWRTRSNSSTTARSR